MLGIFGDRGVFQIAEEKGRPHVLNGYYSHNDQEFADDVDVDGD